MSDEISEKPQRKTTITKVAVTAFAVMGAYNTISDFPANVAKHEHIFLTVYGVILGIVIVVACYALVYGSIIFAFMIATVLSRLFWRLIRRGKSNVAIGESVVMKWFVASQATALVLTVFIAIVTHGQVLRVFTYPFERADKNAYNKMMEQELRNCLSDPHNTSDIAQKTCREMIRFEK